jgi:hypothetical protein
MPFQQNSCPTIISEIAIYPVDKHDELISKSHQEHQVDHHPGNPGKEAGEM